MTANLYWLPDSWPGRLAVGPRPRGADWLEDEIAAWKRAGVNVVVSLLTDGEESDLGLMAEAEATQSRGLAFISFPFPDRGVPDNVEGVTRLAEELSAGLWAGKNILIHCRQGIGRSALVAASVLDLLGRGAEDAIQQISQARGLPVPETPEQRRWIEGFARRRARQTPPFVAQAVGDLTP